LKNAFGFGFGPCRHRGHLNYEESWELGEKYGIFASGGSSVAGTSFISIQGSGCAATKDWQAVHDLVVELNAKITRIDLAHDDYEGIHNIDTALQLYREGAFFNLHGRPPKPQLIDDFDSGDGKTFYLGKRKNGKILRVYEKGKQLGKPDSPWVRWELELHCDAYEIPPVAIIYPGLYLAGSYPCLKWISAETRHFEAVKQSQSIAFEKLLKACKNSYGKLLWTMSEVLEWSNDEIVDELKKEGIPNRMKMPVVGNPD